MAEAGIRFEHCYAQPLCTPSRVKIMTGIYNVRNYVRFGLLDKSQTTFGHLFQDAGYATCVVGKWQLGKDPKSPTQAGFDEHCLWQVKLGATDKTGRDTRFSQPILEVNGEVTTYDKEDYGPQVVSQYGLDFIARSVEKKQPFLLYYPMILTHCPFSPSPDSPEWLSDRKAVMKYKGKAIYFEDMMSYTDKIMGNINRKLKELGIYGNTIVIFTGDNGTDKPIVSTLKGQQVPGAKGKSTDAGTRVPLIVQWPAMIKKGSVSQDLVDFSDFLPTICQAANIEVPSNLNIDGQSFLPQIKGEKGKPRTWVYNWFSRNGTTEKAVVFARNQRFKRYETGAFYDIPNDYSEQNPLDISQLSPEEQAIYNMLGDVLEGYKKRRLEAIKQ
jgi:arylsulfatase A